MTTATVEKIQMKVLGMMCSFCTISIESALKRYPSVKSVLVRPGISRISREELAATSSIDMEVSS